jgi:hypothetical protein
LKSRVAGIPGSAAHGQGLDSTKTDSALACASQKLSAARRLGTKGDAALDLSYFPEIEKCTFGLYSSSIKPIDGNIQSV